MTTAGNLICSAQRLMASRLRTGKGLVRSPRSIMKSARSALPLHLLALTLAPACLAGPADVRPLTAKGGPAPFSYTNAPDALPNYVAGAKWGTQTDPIRTMQVPMSPADSAARLVLQPGFSAALFAAEPEITKPLAMAWDDRGRLWITETLDYPNELQEPGKGRDRIKICTDTDGDGRADQFTVFATDLSIPTSLCFANGGVIVLERGQTLFLMDTDGDGRADERRVLFTGWGMSDTHATASNLRLGLDNWIWGTVGYSGFDGVVGGKPHKFGMGVFRFKADGSELEFIRSSNNNTWGLGITEDGTILGSTANGNAAWYMAMPNRFYEFVRGWSAGRMESVADSQEFYPVTEKVRQVDWHHKYTAGAGSALYTARAFPQEFWNRISFVTEPTGHLVGWFRFEAQGADFRAVNLGSFLASDDEWTAPIAAEVGPDGALWVLDWYNYIVQHNPVPNGFKNGRGNAYETTLRDKRHGRIYRVTSNGGTPTRAPRLQGGSPSDWVAALRTDNQLWRMLAQRMLVDRGQADVAPALRNLVADTSVDTLGLNVGAIHALWTLRGLNSVGPEAVTALKHPSAGVRRAAVSVLPRTGESASAMISAGTLQDPDAQVRLATLLALTETPSDEDLGAAVVAFLANPTNARDRWLREAAAAAGARHISGFGRALLTRQEPLPKEANEAVRIVARHYASDAPDNVLEVVAALSQATPSTSETVLDGIATGWPEDRRPSLSGEQLAGLHDAVESLPPAARARFLVLAQKWGRLDAFADLRAAAVQGLRAQLADSGLTDAERLSAARNLVRLADDAASVEVILQQITPQAPPAFTAPLIGSLSDSRQTAAAAGLIQAWSRLSPGQKRAALGVLLRRPEWSATVLDAVANGGVLRNDLGQEHWQQLRNSPDKAVAARAKELADGTGSISPDRQAVIQKLSGAARNAGDAARGKELFSANCAVCHRLEGVGQSIGPELTGIGARPKADLLIEVLDPNRSVEANYRLWTITTKSGDTLAGRLDAETQTSVDLTDLVGQKHSVARKDIASLESSNQSIMPVGFEALGEDGLAALLAYLATSNVKP